MANNDVKIDRKLLESLGKVYDHIPEERRPYDPSRPEGDAGILKTYEKPKQFNFEIKIGK
ncbi:TPA: hypothetical protein ACWLXL_004354 [Pseudomonas aeruginosa]|uniref:hypothetical protein n=1 Tax=Pseudomonas aeruginosa TaxID=287 RepID=UPI001BD49D31|nr:hypothetical protein [Pseudomonas aeruginosa]MBS9731051.1 hypothetical protein [Pseudomonas aeruginosa]